MKMSMECLSTYIGTEYEVGVLHFGIERQNVGQYICIQTIEREIVGPDKGRDTRQKRTLLTRTWQREHKRKFHKTKEHGY
ncbi:hypothetical protein ACHAXS_004928 [Conticribra weissflogii]